MAAGYNCAAGEIRLRIHRHRCRVCIYDLAVCAYCGDVRADALAARLRVERATAGRAGREVAERYRLAHDVEAGAVDHALEHDVGCALAPIVAVVQEEPDTLPH